MGLNAVPISWCTTWAAKGHDIDYKILYLNKRRPKIEAAPLLRKLS